MVDSPSARADSPARSTSESTEPEVLESPEWRDVQQRPGSPDAWHGLALAFENRDRWEDAENAYGQALWLSADYVPSRNNLAVLLMSRGRIPESIPHWRRLVELHPTEHEWLRRLGFALSQTQALDEALEAFDQWAKRVPDSSAPFRAQAEVLQRLGRRDEALACLEQALRIAPHDKAARVVLASLLNFLGQGPRMLAVLRQGLELCAPADWESLFGCLISFGRFAEAETLLDDWLTRRPDDPIALALARELPTPEGRLRLRADTVRHLFDEYAPRFDSHLLQALDYQGPNLIATALEATLGAPTRQLEILDLGCGTGLCGVAAAPYASRLVGVDLSPGMLEQARRRGVYTQLHSAEITAWCGQQSEPFDVIIAAEVFNYFGDLRPVIGAAKSMLRDSGTLIFTIELLEDGEADYVVTRSGRYQQRLDYVERVLQDHGLHLARLERVVLRKEAREPVWALVLTATASAERLDRADSNSKASRSDSTRPPSPPPNMDALRRRFDEGNSHAEAERHAEAAAAFRDVADALPKLPAAQFNLGNAEYAQGNWEQAAEAYRRAIAVAPNDSAWNNLGNTCVHLQQWNEALECFRAALQFSLKSSQAWNNLGRIYQQQGRLWNALTCYQEAVRRDPRRLPTQLSLGQFLLNVGRSADAQTCFQAALALAPNQRDACLGLSDACLARGQVSAAIGQLAGPLEANPEDASLFVRLGELNLARGSLTEAQFSLLKALELNRNDAQARGLLLMSRLCDPAARTEELKYLAEAAFPAASGAPVTSESNAAPQEVPNQEPSESASGSAGATPSDDRKRPAISHARRDRQPRRVGFLSSHFDRPAIAAVLTAVLPRLDRERFVACCYSHRPVAEEASNRLSTIAHLWRPVAGWSDSALTQQIRDDEIDLLIDLDGPGWPHRLGVVARRPAPVQLTWLGFPVTTGLSAIDFLLADAMSVPAEIATHFTERILQLRPAILCLPPTVARAVPGKRPDGAASSLVFACFSPLAMLSNSTLQQWAAVLNAVPDAQLLLGTLALADRESRERIARLLGAEGVLADRVRLESWERPSELADLMSGVDLLLDPQPIGDLDRAVQALEQGIPVLTRRGLGLAGRAVASVLTAAGHAEWVADSDEEYFGRAVELAEQLRQNPRSREELVEQLIRSPLTDSDAFTRRFEETLEQAWNQTQSRA